MSRLSAVGIPVLSRNAGALQGKVGEEVKLSRCLPEVDDIKAGKVQDIDWHGSRRKERIFSRVAANTVDVENLRQQNCSGVKVVKCLGTRCLRLQLFQFFCRQATQQVALRFDREQPQDLG